MPFLNNKKVSAKIAIGHLIYILLKSELY